MSSVPRYSVGEKVLFDMGASGVVKARIVEITDQKITQGPQAGESYEAYILEVPTALGPERVAVPILTLSSADGRIVPKDEAGCAGAFLILLSLGAAFSIFLR